MIIQFEKVNKWYGKYHALRDIDLSVEPGRAPCHLRALRFGKVDDDPLHQWA